MFGYSMQISIAVGEEFEFNGKQYLPVFYKLGDNEYKQMFGADIEKLYDVDHKVLGYRFKEKWYVSLDTVLAIIYRSLKITLNETTN